MKEGKESKTQSILVVSSPYPVRTKAWMHLFTFIKLLEPLFEKTCIITGNIPKDQIPEGRFKLINFRMEPELKRHLPLVLSLPIWIGNFISGQLKTCYYLLRAASSVDSVLFFSGADVNIVPLMLAKLLRKRVMTMVVEYSPMSVKSAYGTLFAYPYRLLATLNRLFSDRIIVYTESIITWAKLEKYRAKVSVTGEVFIDTDRFRIKKPYAERKNTIGYVSRLSAEKGVLEFLDAIPMILSKRRHTDFLIVGDGILLPRIKERLSKNGLMEKVTLTGWIPRDELPDYMNRLKLLVVPTHTEAGSPQVLQEAMSCGTPVLAAAVGGIGDVIKDGENGFILRESSPEQIARDVLKILEYPHIYEIIQNGRELVEKDYCFEAVARRFEKVFAQGS